ncbi:hypothetical protein OHB12_04945 [Nocardia sp. NBC_01730]|uniref:hypothetical protein n=1 Tax=Nocardia sp. NBC_01730 TaxID=2975998 RepID=UPI002E127767|nr:hypothetical protein OHB12_04945 [Nocardia sp. NBC_01730]
MQPGRNKGLYHHIRQTGWTYATIAEKVNDLVERATGRRGLYTEESIRRLVNGSVSWPQLRYRNALCRLFDTSTDELGLIDNRTSRNTTAREVDVDRQEFLRGIAVASALAALPRPHTQPDMRRTAPSRPRTVGIEHAQHVNAWAGVFRQADDAGHGLSEGMSAQLHLATQYLEATMTPPVERKMKAAVATLYRVVGWSHYDRGDHATALQDFSEGWRLVSDDGPWWLRTALLTCMARQAIYLDRLDDALDKLGIAAIRADKLSLLRRADIAAVKARAFGQQGNRRECIRAVIEAESLFAEAQGEDHPDLCEEGFGAYYSEKLLASDLAQGLFALSFKRGIELEHTFERLATARSLSDEHARSRLLSTTQLAALHLRFGDVDEGVDLATSVLTDAKGTTSARVVDDLRRIYQLTTTPRIRTCAPVAALRTETKALLSTL